MGENLTSVIRSGSLRPVPFALFVFVGLFPGSVWWSGMGRSCMAWGIVIWQRRSCMIKRRVAWQKKESSRTISRVLCVRANVSAIYPIHESPHGFSVLPSTGSRAGNPGGGSIHELAAPKMHSRHVTMPLVSSYLTFSPFQTYGERHRG